MASRPLAGGVPRRLLRFPRPARRVTARQRAGDLRRGSSGDPSPQCRTSGAAGLRRQGTSPHRRWRHRRWTRPPRRLEVRHPPRRSGGPRHRAGAARHIAGGRAAARDATDPRQGLPCVLRGTGCCHGRAPPRGDPWLRGGDDRRGGHVLPASRGLGTGVGGCARLDRGPVRHTPARHRNRRHSSVRSGDLVAEDRGPDLAVPRCCSARCCWQ